MWKRWKGGKYAADADLVFYWFAQEGDWNRKAGEAEAENDGHSSEEEGLKGDKADQNFKE